MQEPRNAVLAADHPRLRQEALEQVGLLLRQGRVVLRRVQKRLRRLRVLHIGHPGFTQTAVSLERLVPSPHQLDRRMLAQRQ